MCFYIGIVLCSGEIYDHQINGDTLCPAPSWSSYAVPMLVPHPGTCRASGGCRCRTKDFGDENAFPLCPFKPSPHMPPMCVSTLWDMSSPLRISNTFTDVKANVLKGPRGRFTTLFMPLVQLSHFGLLPVDRNTRETPLCVENEYKDLGIDFVPAFSSPTVYSEGGIIKDKDGMIQDQTRKRWWQWLTFSPLSWRGTRTPGGWWGRPAPLHPLSPGVHKPGSSWFWPHRFPHCTSPYLWPGSWDGEKEWLGRGSHLESRPANACSPLASELALTLWVPNEKKVKKRLLACRARSLKGMNRDKV